MPHKYEMIVHIDGDDFDRAKTDMRYGNPDEIAHIERDVVPSMQLTLGDRYRFREIIFDPITFIYATHSYSIIWDVYDEPVESVIDEVPPIIAPQTSTTVYQKVRDDLKHRYQNAFLSEVARAYGNQLSGITYLWSEMSDHARTVLTGLQESHYKLGARWMAEQMGLDLKDPNQEDT